MSLLSRRLIGSSPALSSLSASKRSARAGKGPVLKRSAIGAAAFAVAAFGYVAIIGHKVSAQQGQQAQQSQQKGNQGPPIYNPYPPDILPADLDSEIERILREGQVIFDRALDESRAL